MGARLPPRPGAADKPKSGSNNLLKLLDELYAGGMPGAAPAQPNIDGLKMPPKKILEELIVEEEEDESVDPPGNIQGSY